MILISLSSCDSSKEQTSEVGGQDSRVAELTAMMDEQSSEYVDIIDELDTQNKALERDIVGLEGKLNASRKELEATSTEFQEYQDRATSAIQQYIARIQKNGIGDQLPTFKVGNEILQDLEIVAINLKEIKVRHRDGVVTFDKNTAPLKWAEKYLFEKSQLVDRVETSAVAMEDDEATTEKPAEKEAVEASFDPRKAIVIIEGDDGSGTGFFAKSDSSIYLYTAAHVLSGNKTLTIKTIDGREFKKFGNLEVATGVDMVRMRVTEKVSFALDLTPPDGIRPDLAIHALGNSGGGAVINDSEGVVQAVGAESFEISAEVIQGNSGGPIVLSGTTTALGLVTHGLQGREDVWAQDTRFTEIRRFGARLDRQVKWVKIPLTSFLAEPEKLLEFDRVTRLLYALAVLRPSPDGLRLNTLVNGQTSALQIFHENRDMSAVQELIKMNTELGNKRIKPDAGVIKRRFATFYRGIVSGSNRQVAEIQELSPYHRDIAKNSMTARKEAHSGVSKLLAALTD